MKIVLLFLCVLAALGLHVLADYLTAPISGKGAGELSSEMAESISSSIAAFFSEIFEKEYEIKGMSYDLVWNLTIPFILLCIATFAFGYVCYQLFKTIVQEENTKLTNVWLVLLALLFIIIVINSALKAVALFVLNIAVTATILFIFLCIGSLLNAFNDNNRSHA